MRKFIVAPDSFKECMTAQEASSIIKEAIQKVIADAEVVTLPMADGGEGTSDVLSYSLNGEWKERTVTDPLGRKIKSRFLLSGNGKVAVIEMAKASGLHLVSPSERNPLVATSFGLGELILSALDYSVEEVLITIGGSATNDGGAGMLQALGAKLTDDSGKEIGFGAKELMKLSKIDLQGLDERLQKVTLKVACDVDNPLVGERGATYVFGPQKGATPEMLPLLEQNIKHFSQVVETQLNTTLQDIPGGGAAGGVGVALHLVGATLQSGIHMVFDLIGFEEKILDADYILTGEGKIDDQTPHGKVISGITQIAAKHRKPVIAFAGTVEDGYQSLYERGLVGAYSICTKPETLEAALKHGPDNLASTVENVMRVLYYQSLNHRM